jgi:adenosylmethionine-8-amino-7-oxononanoate aminotransferase
MTGQVFHRRLGHDYPVVKRGEGVYLHDTEGRRYLDGSGGALVVNIGHGVTEIADAMAEQARRVAFAHGTHFSSGAIETYAAALSEVSPVPDARAYLVSGGSEATETAFKLARQVCLARGEPGRYKIIARWGSYHGATLGALSASGRSALRRPYAPLLVDMPHVPPAYCYRCPFGKAYPACEVACADALEAEILRQGPETVAAFVAEPVVGATLCAAVPPPEYWPRVREICDRYGVLLIADEVMTGCGRTGRWFAMEHWDVVPDILATAKGASGGYFPLGAVMVKGELVDAIRDNLGGFIHGFTHANGVLGATVGLAVLRYVQNHNLVAASARKGSLLLEKLGSLRALPAVGDVRGLGLMAGVELVADRETKAPFPRVDKVAERVQAATMARGLITYYGTGMADGVDGDAILLGPPFIITEPQIDELVAALHGALVEITS